MKIALVQPTFTAAAYNNAFYVFYNKYNYAHNVPIVCWSCVQDLYAVVPDMGTWPTNAAISPVLNINGTINTIANNIESGSTVDLVTDQEIDAGMAVNYDALFLFHNEYLTQKEYTNIQNFVNNGGKLVAMDGNVFFAEVEYAEPGTTLTDSNHIRLVSGHFWNYGGSNIANQTPNVGERWASETLGWFGSNSDAGPTVYEYGYLNVKFVNNPWNYPAGQSGVENQYIPKNELSKVNILLNFNANYSYPVNSGWSVGVYEKTYGSGKILCYGCFTDRVQTNPNFQAYLNTSLTNFLTPTAA